MIVGFIGGAADDSFGTRVVKTAYLHYSQFTSETCEYFEWTEKKRLIHWVNDHNGAVKLISHSYGAAMAARQVASGLAVQSLITVDPVGWRRPHYPSILENCETWINVNATGFHGTYRSFQNNAVAAIGGAWRSAPASYAHHYIHLKDCDHVEVFRRYWQNLIETESELGSEWNPV